MTSADLRALVRKRLGVQGQEWAVFDEVRNETGFTTGKPTRSADMVAMNLWRSKGLEVHGFELKVSRGDFLKELADPEKAEAIKRYCDRWWLVAPQEVLNGDLPRGWGWLRPGPTGDLEVAVRAPKLQPVPLDRLFVAALVRRIAEAQESVA